MKTTKLKFTNYGNTKSLMSFCLMLLALLVTLNSFADARAIRRNNCRNKDRKYIVDFVKVNGPNSCNRKLLERRHCTETVELRVNNFVNNRCGCSDYYSPDFPTTAGEAWGISGPNSVGDWGQVFTSCRRFRAGSNQLISEPLTLPQEEGVAITNKALILGGTENYDYINNTYTLNNFTSELHIAAPNLFNHYAIIRMEIVKINTDANGIETDQILASSQGKIINGQFVVSQQGLIFSQSDFIVTQSDGAIHATFSFESKTINLNYDITEDMDLEIRMISDVGNIEDGESEVENDPVSMIISNTNNSQATFQLQSDINRVGNLSVRNAAGTILWSQSNIALTPNQLSEYTFITNSSSTLPFYIVQFVSSDGIIILRKFIIH